MKPEDQDCATFFNLQGIEQVSIWLKGMEEKKKKNLGIEFGGAKALRNPHEIDSTLELSSLQNTRGSTGMKQKQ